MGAVQGNMAQAQTPTDQHNGAKAQNMTPEQRVEKRTTYLTTKLALSTEQTTKVKEALTNFEKNRTPDKAALKKNKENFDQQMAGILDPEQMEKYKAVQEERKEEIKKAMDEREKEKAKSGSTEEDKSGK